MELAESNLIILLNELLKESGKIINSLDELSNFNYLSEIIKIM